jgi:hypothetical protein
LVDGSRPVRRLFELTGHEHLHDAGGGPEWQPWMTGMRRKR